VLHVGGRAWLIALGLKVAAPKRPARKLAREAIYSSVAVELGVLCLRRAVRRPR
jgi:hypothetical protein